MLRVFVEIVRMTAKRIQYEFLRRNHGRFPMAPCFWNLVKHRLLTNLLGAAACLAVATQPAFSGEGQSDTSGQTQAGSITSIPLPLAEKPAFVPEGVSGMTIYIDPQTGAILKEPAPGTAPLQLTSEILNALSTSDQGLVEVPLPGGGFKLDLQGRFQSPLVGTIDANGKVKMQHLDESSISKDQKGSKK